MTTKPVAPTLDAWEYVIGGVRYVIAEMDTATMRRFQRIAAGKSPDVAAIEGLRLTLRRIDDREVTVDDLQGEDWIPKRGKDWLKLQLAFERTCIGGDEDDPFAGRTAVSVG